MAHLRSHLQRVYCPHSEPCAGNTSRNQTLSCRSVDVVVAPLIDPTKYVINSSKPDGWSGYDTAQAHDCFEISTRTDGSQPHAPMQQAAPPGDRKSTIWVIAIVLAAMLISMFLLPTIFGPTDDGIRCSRLTSAPDCQILQTSFFGRNSSFPIKESSISGAEGICYHSRTAGHSSPLCVVNLILDPSEPYRRYPVLSYMFQSQADASAQKLNAYLKDKTARSIELRESNATPLLLYRVAPFLAAIVVLLGGRWIRSRQSSGGLKAV